MEFTDECKIDSCATGLESNSSRWKHGTDHHGKDVAKQTMRLSQTSESIKMWHLVWVVDIANKEYKRYIKKYKTYIYKDTWKVDIQFR